MTKLDLLTAVAKRMPALKLDPADVYILALASRGEITASKITKDLGTHARTADRHIRTLWLAGYIRAVRLKRPLTYVLGAKGEDLLKEIFSEPQP